jgi:hypothetical protein
MPRQKNWKTDELTDLFEEFYTLLLKTSKDDEG